MILSWVFKHGIVKQLFIISIFLSTFLSAAAPVVNLKGNLSSNQGAFNYSINLDLPEGTGGVALHLYH